MSNQDQALKGILKSLKAINAALGTVANNDLAEDIQAAITNEEAVNAVIDLAQLSIGTPSGTNSVATQFTQLWAVLEGV